MIRWIKSLRDAQQSKGRLLLIFVSLFTGLLAFSSIAAIRSVVAREMTRDYRSSLPASVTFDVGEMGISDALFAKLLAHPTVRSAERRATRGARFRQENGQWKRAHLFFRTQTARTDIATLAHERGQRQPGAGETFNREVGTGIFRSRTRRHR